MRLCCVADLHGTLPDLSNLNFDILLIGGDITPHPAKDFGLQTEWGLRKLGPWLSSIGKPVVAVAGNHDFAYQDHPSFPRMFSWRYVFDEEVTVNGLRIYGSPWQPTFHNWAFNLDEPDLKEKWEMVPQGTDVLLLHGPPHGYGDLEPYGNTRTGSPSLLDQIDNISPKLIVFGHIHSGYGLYRRGESILVNASLANEEYFQVNPPLIVEL